MPRKKISEIRRINPDAKYGSLIIGQLINYVMKEGKKNKAENLVYKSLKLASLNIKKDPAELFAIILDNLKPFYEVKPRRIGGSTYQIPVEVKPKRSLALALKWLVMYARNRHKEKEMKLKLSGEMIDAFLKKGDAYKKKEDTHKMAESNQAFAHYRW